MASSFDSSGKFSRFIGKFGMIVSITVGLYLIFPAGEAQSKVANLLVSLGIAIALSVLTFKALLKSQKVE